MAQRFAVQPKRVQASFRTPPQSRLDAAAPISSPHPRGALGLAANAVVRLTCARLRVVMDRLKKGRGSTGYARKGCVLMMAAAFHRGPAARTRFRFRAAIA